ncbi:hypothetical protein J6590_069168 [Homalodisca vitripennis]|nr:hypothetical protein J6590_069168 [Homalodisca vitripennis]
MNIVKSAVFQKSITDHYSSALTIAATVAASVAVTDNTAALPTCVNRTLLTDNLIHSDWIGHNLASLDAGGEPLMRDSDLRLITDFVLLMT